MTERSEVQFIVFTAQHISTHSAAVPVTLRSPQGQHVAGGRNITGVAGMHVADIYNITAQNGQHVAAACNIKGKKRCYVAHAHNILNSQAWRVQWISSYLSAPYFF
jgi:hypothetical protein